MIFDLVYAEEKHFQQVIFSYDLGGRNSWLMNDFLICT